MKRKKNFFLVFLLSLVLFSSAFLFFVLENRILSKKTKLKLAYENEIALGISKDNFDKDLDAYYVSGYLLQSGKTKILLQNKNKLIDVSQIILEVPRSDGTSYKVKAISWNDSFQVTSNGTHFFLFSAQPVLDALQRGQQVRLVVAGNIEEKQIRDFYTKNLGQCDLKCEELIEINQEKLLQTSQLLEIQSNTKLNEVTVFFLSLHANLKQ